MASLTMADGSSAASEAIIQERRVGLIAGGGAPRRCRPAHGVRVMGVRSMVARQVGACAVRGAARRGRRGSDRPSVTGVTGATGATGATGETGATRQAWAVGGTAAMVDKASYPDPFPDDVGCALLCATTEGPCTADTVDREDISEGFSGLPVRLLLRVVDTECTPLAGATVSVWHTQRTGVYSGVTPSGAFCYGDDPSAVNHLYFRGTRTTGDDGVAAYDTCFPGWYASRVPHIHVEVTLASGERFVTQVVFDEAICDEIYGTHEEYEDFGLQETTLADDNVLGAVTNPDDYVMTVAPMSDGAMRAHKTLIVGGSC